MHASLRLAVMAAVAGLCSGCLDDEFRRGDGITVGAGDTVAGNTVMQMVDPWQYGVQDTQLLVPADRGASAAAEQQADDAGQSQTMTSN